MISANNVTLRLGKKALFEDVNIKFTSSNNAFLPKRNVTLFALIILSNLSFP